MIINLSYEQSEVDYFISKLQNAYEEILDVTGVVQNSTLPVQYARKIDQGATIELKALDNYIRDIGLLSTISLGKNRSIRDFEINGLPIYWLTNIAVKHDSFHWGQALYYLKQLLQDKPALFQKSKNFAVILPRNAASIARVVQDIIQVATGKQAATYISEKETYNWISFSRSNLGFLYQYLILSFRVRFARKPKESIDSKSQIPNQFIKTNIPNSTIEVLEQFASTHSQSYTLPMCLSWPHLNSHAWKERDLNILKSFPGITSILRVLVKMYQCYYRLNKVTNQELGVLSKTFTFNCLLPEFSAVLHYPNYFFTYLWSKNYFEQCQTPAKFFLEDEFYQPGRVICAAARSAKNPMVQIIGVQHGVITKNHTVYKITSREIKSIKEEDGLPIPHRFAVWGDHFRKEFLKFNELSPDYILVPGNLKYIQLQSKIEERGDRTDQNQKKKLSFLWCTTTSYHTSREYQILRHLFTQKEASCEIRVRLHPAGHINEHFINNLLEESHRKLVKFSSNEVLFDDLLECDVVISNMLSTIFLDALVAGKKVIRIITPIALRDFNFLDNLRDVETKEDLLLAVDNLKLKNQNGSFDQVLYLNKDRWLQILN